MTSKVDIPPPYEEAVHHPKLDHCPHQPHHGVTLPPSPCYNPSLVRCGSGYWDQSSLYPQCGGPGFPPAGVPTPIPTLSAGVPVVNAGMESLISSQWESTSIRHAFIRKVYLILTAQLAVTFSVVAVFTFVDPVRRFVIKYPGIYWASFFVYFVVYMILFCCKELRRRFPCNLVLLGVFTLALSYVSGSISSYYSTKVVFLAMVITAVVCMAVTVFCFQTKVDFTSCGGLLCITGVLLAIIGAVTAVVLSFHYVPWLQMLYAAIGAFVYTMFLVYNTQLMIGNRQFSLSPEEYVYGALSLYIDIIHIFFFLLLTGGAAD